MQLSPEQQSALCDLCRRYGVRALQMFGSAAVGLETAESDVDLLVEFTSGQAPSAFELIDLREALSQLLGGRPVDLAFAGILDNPYRRRAIVPQLLTLYSRDQQQSPRLRAMVEDGLASGAATVDRRADHDELVAIARGDIA
jgi:uncharacterized protein